MFERYYRELLNFLAGKVFDRDTAADLTQESFARIYAAQQAGTAIRNPRALLYRIARNLVIDHQRHGDVRATIEQAPPPDAPVETDDHIGQRNFEPEVTLSSHQGIAAMVAAIEALAPRCREAFMLNRFDGLSYAEVAMHMGISVKTVEFHLKTALDACERCRVQSSGQPRVQAGSPVYTHKNVTTP